MLGRVDEPSVSAVMLVSWPRRAAMIDDAVRSFQAQTWAQKELVVVNEGAPLRALQPGVTVVNTGPRRSLGQQRNEGLAAARGAWLATWDDDDFSLPTRLARLIGRALETGAELARTDRVWFADAALRPVCVARGPFFATSVVRRATALAAGGWPPLDLLEDADFERTLRARGRPLVVVPELLYCARRHDANITHARGETPRSSFARCDLAADAAARSALAAAIAAARSAPYPRVLAPAIESPDGRWEVLVGLYDDADPGRLAEFATCLARHAAHPRVARVHVFDESPFGAPDLAARVPALAHPKVVRLRVRRRMRFADFFSYANAHLPGHRVALVNTDIFFDETLARLDGYPLEGRLLALSRWDEPREGPPRLFERPDSQDAWLFQSPLRPFPAAWHLGKPGCDNRLADTGGWTTTMKNGRAHWTPPPLLDVGQPRTNQYHHPTLYPTERGDDDGGESDTPAN